jgi:GntR family transcriptional repressor for pyruvate dehydrogenase complex
MKKSKRISVSDGITEHLVSLIDSGELRPGDRLPSEHELMRQLSVGRSSVREAIRGLAMAGILEAAPRRGTTVVSSVANSFGDQIARSVTYWALQDLYEVRMILEGHAAGAAAHKASDEEIEIIERYQKDLEKKIWMGASYFKANSNFHLAIAKASKNSALFYCLSSIIDNLRDSREQINRMEIIPKQDIVYHRRILEAIKARDSKKARQLMQAHLRKNIAGLERPDDG